MNSIEQYLQEEYIIEKNRIKEVDSLISNIIDTFKFYNAQFGWPYEIDDNSDLKSLNNFSYSTNSMILFLLGKFLNKIDYNSAIIPYINWEINDILLNKVNSFEPIYKNLKNLLFNKCLNNNYSSKGIIVTSNTFGKNDPFTLSWLSEILSSDQIEPNIIDKFIPNFIEVSINLIEKAFENPEKPILILDLNDENNRASEHIFPLLGIIHLYKNLTKEKFTSSFSSFITIYRDKLNRINELANNNLLINLTNRINQQLSHTMAQNDLFDTAELVLSIEALILIDHTRQIDENLLNKAFEILKNNQQRNQYWRPLKPFITSPRGHILLPLSIEIANSLLRSCKHLEKNNKYYFNDFFEIFEKYTKWLFSNVAICKPEGAVLNNLMGWHSENVQKQNVIHPWETAQVIIYLMNYKTLLQEQISYKSFKKVGFSCEADFITNKEDKISIEFWKDSWEVKEPLVGLGDKYNVFERIGEDFIKSRIEDNINKKYSMLIYGPPGTGKTSLAKFLAQSLNWKLITITPSDFIKHGEAGIEERAKCIFRTLEEQKDCVVLFDEIDRLILDRNSEYYSGQSDMFQFMTPSMLVKFRELRLKKKIVFIIATNYVERLDSAIKRKGRIDTKYIICPPDKNQRIRIIKKLLTDFNFPNIKEESINNISNKTALFTYGELKLLLATASDNIKPNFKESKCLNVINKALNEQDKPTINLTSYSSRLPKRINNHNSEIFNQIFPFEEFFLLVYLLCEVDHTFSKEEQNIIKKTLEIMDNGQISSYIKNKNVVNLIKNKCLKKLSKK